MGTSHCCGNYCECRLDLGYVETLVVRRFGKRRISVLLAEIDWKMTAVRVWSGRLRHLHRSVMHVVPAIMVNGLHYYLKIS